MLKKFFPILLDILFPLVCCGCGAEGTLLCPACERRLPVLFKLVTNPSPHLNFVLICLNYESPIVRSLMHQFKYGGVTGVADSLGNILVRGLEHIPQNDRFTVVPVPLHKRKQRIRGFNQSELLARKLTAATGQVLNMGLLRKRFTRSQTRLNRKQRLRNLAGCFSYAAGKAPERVLLIDDVATTFSTLDEAARELKKAGSKCVGALVVAKNEDISAV